MQLQIAQSLNYQQSPSLQIAAIDLIVKYNIREGKKTIEKLLKKTDLNATVKEQAKLALQVMS